jgi:predicted RecA/RadA family phage recombinase
MATAVYRQQGAAIDHTPGGDVAAGAVIVQGELVGVARLDIKANTLGALAVEGVFDFPKATGGGTAIGAGAEAYWNAAAQQATTSAASGANKRIGRAVRAAADGDTLVRVRLSQ